MRHNHYWLSHQEMVSLNRAVARAMTGKSVLHPMGRVPIPLKYRETLVLHGSFNVYPRTGSYVIPSHRKAEQP